MVPSNNINYNGVTGMSRMIGMGNIKTQLNNRILPNAFSIMTLEDPSWNMDTGVSSHLNSHSSNLSTVYNNCLYPSVRVGNGKTIPVTNTGHSILPTLSRPLYLHNVLVTPNIIKILNLCDSSGDLYPVTKPSPTPSALLSVSHVRGTNVSDTPVQKCYDLLFLVIIFRVIKRSLHLFVMLANLENM
ncbi:hypothetical protein Tco_0294821 [Tanacetum coccineum]